LDVASCLIGHNQSRIKKVLRTEKPKGAKVCVFEAVDEKHEAQFLVNKLQSMDGVSAILCRTSSNMPPFEKAMKEAETLPSFYNRSEVKDVLSFARFLSDNEDFEAFARIVNLPKRGLGPKTLEKLGATGKQFEKAAREHKGLREFFAAVDTSGKQLRTFLEMSGYMQMRRIDHSRDARQKLENVEFLINQSEAQPSLFCRNFEKPREKRIFLLTIHSAKGLEFDNVALSRWEEGIIPHFLCEIDKERRLAYVGITRAKSNLIISYAKYRGGLQQTIPSRFLNELSTGTVPVQTLRCL
jgi:DNA helicase-2/ATP-dependent DNA helicase PcrA